MNSLIKRLIKFLIPDRYHYIVAKICRKLLYIVARPCRKLLYFGISRYCPVCNSHLRQFLPFSVKPDKPRPNALCPVCGALERHRLLFLYFYQKTNLLSSARKRMLHIAPEPCLRHLFTRINSIDYLTLDLEPYAMIQADLTQLCFADETFDVVMALHVLEHIVDDRRAMREIFRILKTSGLAFIIVPINSKVTFEDPSVIDPSERERIYGHPHHVRIYGEDFYDRLRESGFTPHRIKLQAQLDPRNRQKFGLISDEEITFFSKN